MDEERLLVANEALIKAYKRLDPTSPTYNADLEAIAKIHKELANDIHNARDVSAKESETALEKERLEEDKKANMSKLIMDAIGKIILVGTTTATIWSQLWMYRRSTEKETDEVISSQTDKITISNGLSGRFFKFFGN